MFVNSVCIAFLTQCNWHCRYCIASNNSISIDEDAIYSELYPIRYKLEKLWISGGEPGLLSDDFWLKLFDSINFKLKICTNGTFIKRQLYDKYKDRISNLMIHCVSELDKDIDPDVLSVIREDNNRKIETNIVIHKHNGHLIKDFLTKYSDIEFKINFTDKTFAAFTDTEYDYCIDQKSAEYILSQLIKVKGYGIYSNQLLLSILKNNYDHINHWSHQNISIE